MKGFYIYEVESRIGTVVECLELGDIDNIFTHEIAHGTITEEVKMHALVSKGTKTKCSKDDTYDFETGALIALMKMCGVDKVVRACNEAFPKETYNTYITKFENELNTLKKDFDKVRDLKDYYKKNYEDVKEHYDKLGDRNKYLIEDINKKLEYIKEKEEEIKELKLIITNLHQECQRLYQIGFSNGVEVARTEYANEFKKLEDRGLISCHGFLKSESKSALDNLKLDEACKTLKEKTEIHTCYHKICTGCKDLHLDSANGSLKRYTCKMKGISILANCMPKPENFAEAFKKER